MQADWHVQFWKAVQKAKKAGVPYPRQIGFISDVWGGYWQASDGPIVYNFRMQITQM